MRVLLTGAAGCIGRATARALHREGHEVIACLRGPAPPSLLEVVHQAEVFDLENLDEEKALELTLGVHAVVHLAGLVHRPDVQAFAPYRRLAVDVSELLLQALRKQAGAEAPFVFASTVAIYGRAHGRQLDEQTPPGASLSAYAATKLEGETVVRAGQGCALRFPVVYGEGDRGNVARMASAMQRRRFVEPWPTEGPRSMLASENAAHAICLALRRPEAAGQVFIVTDDEDLSLSDVIASLAQGLGVRPPTRVPLWVLTPLAWLGSALQAVGIGAPLSRPTLEKLTRELTFRPTLVKEQLGYAPRVSARNGLRSAGADVANGGQG